MGERLTTSIDARAMVRRPLLALSPLERYTGRVPRVAALDGMTLTSFAGDGPDENYVFVYVPVDLQAVLAGAHRFFGSDAFSIVVESGTNDALEAVLVADGWPLDEDEPSMLLHPIPALPASPDSLDIRPVKGETDYEAFMRISETGRRWVPSLAAATDPNVCLLVGFVEGEPVATARISCLGDVGEINGVVTAPSHRRRGLGTAMTWAAVAEGVTRGCTSIVLSASEMGYPVYLRMGFVPVCSYRTYLPPEAGVSATSADSARAPRDS